MLNFDVHSISFCPCLLKPVELNVRNRKISLPSKMFQSACLKYSDKTILVETFIATQKIFFGYNRVIDVFNANS